MSQDSTSYSVVSERVLDAQYWNRNGYEYEDPETFEKETIYNNYEKSEIRTWLNEEFLNIAFSDEEKNKIPTTLVDNSLDSTLDEANKYVCGDTEDKIYLLSRKEATSYLFSSNDENRIANATDYVKAIGVDGLSTNNETYGDCEWWLRSPTYNHPYYVYYVLSDGDVKDNNAVDFRCGVRPALHINL